MSRRSYHYKVRTPFYLTDRERAVILGLLRGDTTADVAARLGIPRDRPADNLSHVRDRWGAANNLQLVYILLTRGAISSELLEEEAA